MILGILMSNEVKIAVLETQVERLLEKQKELTERVRANEKVVAAIGLLGSVVIAILGTGIFQKAEACSPRLDGEPTYCPPWDDDVAVCLSLDCPRKAPPLYPRPDITDQSFEDELDPNVFDQGTVVTLYDTRVAHMGHDVPTWPTAGEMIQAIREEEARKNRNSIDDMLNSALEDMEINYGSNGSTESEELLQLSSDRD
jgi:hypothetical protein